jgi:hypothetical protein
MNLEITGRKGALTTYKIVDGLPALESIEDIAFGYGCRVEGNDVIGTANKAAIRALKAMVGRVNAAAASEKGKTININAPKRVLVEAGTYTVGDTLHGFVVTGLGRMFTPNADQYSANGINPAAEYVQYAYFSK